MVNPDLANEFCRAPNNTLQNSGRIVNFRAFRIFRLAVHAPLKKNDLKSGD